MIDRFELFLYGRLSTLGANWNSQIVPHEFLNDR
jgi:hypothetical protein